MRSNNGITLIQGDTFDAILKIDGLCCLLDGGIFVTDCVFSVVSLNLNISLQQVQGSDEEFSLTIPSNISSSLAPGATSYDITIYLSDGTVKTVLYNQGLAILPKTNDRASINQELPDFNNSEDNSSIDDIENFGDRI